MPPYGLISLADRPFGVTDITLGVDIPEELAARGYGEDILYDYDPAFGGLKTTERYQPAPFTGARPFQAMYDIAPYTSNGINLGFNADLYNPSFGGVSGYRDTGGIMGIMQEEDEEDQLPYSGVGDMRYQTPRTIADQNRILGQTFTEQEPSGIAKLFQRIGDIYSALPTPTNLIRGFAERIGEPSRYSRFSPGGSFRGGIYNIGGVNTPFQLANDFYDRTTGLNRFDRARNRFNQTRSLKDLFGASRTLAEFNNARKIAAAQKASGYTSNFMDRPASERNYTGPSGGDNTGGDVGAARASDSFSNRSGMGRTGY